MEMKINRSRLKSLRTDKLWSQEQLAEAAGLSLRTIQRVESSGKTSMDSLAAIAAALETDKALLLEAELEFKAYRHTQYAYLMWVVSFSFLSIYLANLQRTTMASHFIVAGVMFIIVVLFFSLSIRVSEDRINWHFGPRFWKKELLIADIASCNVVRNNVLMGWGIRMLSDGWMYNVSGLLAVEIRLKSGSAIRLGSDEPNYLKEAIDGAIALHNSRAA